MSPRNQLLESATGISYWNQLLESATGISYWNQLLGSLEANTRILAPFRPNPSVLCDIAQGIDVVDRPL